ncbi:MAG: biotin transporter BioY [Candidatus Caenarcaniphilales bacterium]|nr:biotin transporter BioY [Candidatus Caenarcaniphilales bacterium]
MFTDFSRTLFIFSLMVLANYTVFSLFSYEYSPLFLVVFLAAVLFRKNYATVACLCFIILGLFGLPCFNFGAGISYLKEPSIVYIISLIPFSIYAFVSKEKNPLFAFLVLHFTANLLLILFGNFNPYRFIDYSIVQLIFDLALAGLFFYGKNLKIFSYNS